MYEKFVVPLLRHGLRPVVFAIGLALLAEFWLTLLHGLNPQLQPAVSPSVILLGAAVLGAGYGVAENLIRRGALRSSV